MVLMIADEALLVLKQPATLQALRVEALGEPAPAKCKQCAFKRRGDVRCIVLGPNQRCHCCIKQHKICSFSSKQKKRDKMAEAVFGDDWQRILAGEESE
jgi:hypothetical protein